MTAPAVDAAALEHGGVAAPEAAGEPARFRGALASRSLRGLVVAHSLGTAAQLALTLAVGLEVLSRTTSGIWVSIAVALGFAPYAVFSGAAGALADRWSAPAVIGATVAVRGATSAAVTAGIVLDWSTPVLVLLAAVTAVCATPSYPATAAATPQCVPAGQLPAANALVTAAENVVWLAGPGLLGLLMLVGRSTAVATGVSTLCFVLATVVAARVRLPRRAAHPASWWRAMGEGLHAVYADRAVRVPMTVAVIDNFLYGFLLVAMMLTAVASFGLLNGALTCGALAALTVVNRCAGHGRSRVVLMVVMTCLCGSVAAFAVVGATAATLSMLAVAGAGTMVAEVVAVTMLQRAARPDVLARVFGVFDQVNVGAIALGSFAAGQLSAAVGVRPATLAVCALCLVATALTLGLGRRRRREAQPIPSQQPG
ncbi:MFS transporter [Angustibacter luteus]|uniref:MFS transporter n=1 Tax=Angustibacter luteus TaxID=658456 RepID=A0ABW1JDW0_9ACTN